eukprot:126175-Chlamydomonas_euryale.AAC.1
MDDDGGANGDASGSAAAKSVHTSVAGAAGLGMCGGDAFGAVLSTGEGNGCCHILHASHVQGHTSVAGAAYGGARFDVAADVLGAVPVAVIQVWTLRRGCKKRTELSGSDPESSRMNACLSCQVWTLSASQAQTQSKEVGFHQQIIQRGIKRKDCRSACLRAVPSACGHPSTILLSLERSGPARLREGLKEGSKEAI